MTPDRSHAGHLREGISQSALKVLHDRQPAGYWYQYGDHPHPQEETEAMRKGTALHVAVLEPARWGELIAVRPECDRRTKEGKAISADFDASSAGKTIISADDAEHIKYATAHLTLHRISHDSDKTVGDLLRGAKVEHGISWTDEQTGVLCRATIDALCMDGRIAIDVKSTRDASPQAFSRDVAERRYDVQAAFYVDGARACGFPVERWLWLAVELTPPYLCAVYALDPEDMEGARHAYRADLDLFRTCCQNGRWPGYESAIKILSLSKWARDERTTVRQGE
jgi:hypothetical protein